VSANDRFDRVAKIVLRANPKAAAFRRDLRRRISDLHIVVGATDDGTKAGVAFRKDSSHPADHAAMAKQFRKIAAADGPLDSSVCSEIVLAKLIAATRRKGSPRLRQGEVHRLEAPRGVSLDSLSESERKNVKARARGLAQYHQSQVQRKRPNKNALDTLLEELGDIYAGVTEFTWHRHALPHSIKSRFVRFCHLILQPYFDPSEVTPKAISNRWKRLKDRG